MHKNLNFIPQPANSINTLARKKGRMQNVNIYASLMKISFNFLCMCCLLPVAISWWLFLAIVILISIKIAPFNNAMMRDSQDWKKSIMPYILSLEITQKKLGLVLTRLKWQFWRRKKVSKQHLTAVNSQRFVLHLQLSHNSRGDWYIYIQVFNSWTASWKE